eukprot:scaffold61301_cov45-Attheya_sp.AAC.5
MPPRLRPWYSSRALMITPGKPLARKEKEGACCNIGDSICLHSASDNVRASRGYASCFEIMVDRDCQASPGVKNLVRMGTLSAHNVIFARSWVMACLLLPSDASHTLSVSAARTVGFNCLIRPSVRLLGDWYGNR